jgi:hypothetical protein
MNRNIKHFLGIGDLPFSVSIEDGQNLYVPLQQEDIR